MSKHDRQGVRTAVDLERKYDLGSESKAIKLASDAQRAAERANNAADEAKTASTQAVGAVASMQESVDKNATDIEGLAERVETLENTTPSEGGDGFSPTVEVSKSGTVTTLTITDVNGTEIATIYDGEDGKDGKDGEQGEPGTSGVYIGSDEPTSETINVWIDPNGEGISSDVLTVEEIRAICK